MTTPGILIDRTTNCFSYPENIRTEMEEMKTLEWENPTDLQEILREMAEDLAFSENLYGEPAT